MAVLQWQSGIVGSEARSVSIVAIHTEVVRAKALVLGLGAAKLALPVNKIFTVFLAARLPCANLLQKAVLAKHVLWFDGPALLVGHILLAVAQTPKVGLLALEALIESASLVGGLLGILFLAVLPNYSLLFGLYKRLFADKALQVEQWAQLSGNRC